MAELKNETLHEVSGGVILDGDRYVGPCFEYTVVEGDTLNKLARRFGTTVDILYNLNRDRIKDKNLICVGWKLLIPAISK